MNLKLTFGADSRLTANSRSRLRSLLESAGGVLGESLAAEGLRQIERQLEAVTKAVPQFAFADFWPQLLSADLSPGVPVLTALPVHSSDFRRIGYDPSNSTLKIEFRRGGVYEFFPVPYSEYAGLLRAGSPGKYFLAHIKGRYSYRKISG